MNLRMIGGVLVLDGFGMNDRFLRQIMFSLVFGVISCSIVYGENIDPNNDASQYAWGENVGWLNAEPLGDGGPGVQVEEIKLTGYIWAENIGWISLSCENTSSCARVDYAVTNDSAGLLSGYAWGENVGWLNFDPNVPGDPNRYGVNIDSEGNFSGWSWGQNIGWVHFQSAGPVPYKVRTSWMPYAPTPFCIVDYDDLSRFCGLWLEAGPGLRADFDASNDVNFADYSTLAEKWFQECPEDWPLQQ